MLVTIDRFEGEYAIVEIEEGRYAKIERILLPDMSEGDVISITADTQRRDERRTRIEELKNSIFED